MYTIENLKCLLLVLCGTIAQNGNPKSPCGIPNQEGLCRFIKPCKPTLLPGNDSFMIVSWKGLFEGCHEDQFNKMYLKIKNKKGELDYQKIEKTSFSKNTTTISTDVCEDSLISLRIYFNEERRRTHPGQNADITTHDINCTIISITDKAEETIATNLVLVASITGSILVAFILIIAAVIFICKQRRKTNKRMIIEEKDINPVYGDYYYQDGNRRQNIVEVLIVFYDHCFLFFVFAREGEGGVLCPKSPKCCLKKLVFISYYNYLLSLIMIHIKK